MKCILCKFTKPVLCIPGAGNIQTLLVLGSDAAVNQFQRVRRGVTSPLGLRANTPAQTNFCECFSHSEYLLAMPTHGIPYNQLTLTHISQWAPPASRSPSAAS